MEAAPKSCAWPGHREAPGLLGSLPVTRNPLSWDMEEAVAFSMITVSSQGAPLPPTLPTHGHTPPSRLPSPAGSEIRLFPHLQPKPPSLAPPDSPPPNVHLSVHGRVIPRFWIFPAVPGTHTNSLPTPLPLCLLSYFHLLPGRFSKGRPPWPPSLLVSPRTLAFLWGPHNKPSVRESSRSSINSP